MSETKPKKTKKSAIGDEMRDLAESNKAQAEVARMEGDDATAAVWERKAAEKEEKAEQIDRAFAPADEPTAQDATTAPIEPAPSPPPADSAEAVRLELAALQARSALADRAAEVVRQALCIDLAEMAGRLAQALTESACFMAKTLAPLSAEARQELRVRGLTPGFEVQETRAILNETQDSFDPLVVRLTIALQHAFTRCEDAYAEQVELKRTIDTFEHGEDLVKEELEEAKESIKALEAELAAEKETVKARDASIESLEVRLAAEITGREAAAVERAALEARLVPFVKAWLDVAADAKELATPDDSGEDSFARIHTVLRHTAPNVANTDGLTCELVWGLARSIRAALKVLP